MNYSCPRCHLASLVYSFDSSHYVCTSSDCCWTGHISEDAVSKPEFVPVIDRLGQALKAASASGRRS